MIASTTSLYKDASPLYMVIAVDRLSHMLTKGQAILSAGLLASTTSLHLI